MIKFLSVLMESNSSMMFYDSLNNTYPHAYLCGDILSPDLKGVKVELSYTRSGKLLASFQPKDFPQVSRLDMRTLLAQAIERATDSNVRLTSEDGTVVLHRR